jgi:hypothetical protein
MHSGIEYPTATVVRMQPGDAELTAGTALVLLLSGADRFTAGEFGTPAEMGDGTVAVDVVIDGTPDSLPDGAPATVPGDVMFVGHVQPSNHTIHGVLNRQPAAGEPVGWVQPTVD